MNSAKAAGERVRGNTVRGIIRSLAIAGLLVSMLGTGAASAVVGCAGESTGGDWPAFGHDASNTHNQPLEDQISPATAYSLTPRWRFSLASAGATGGFQSVPIVADGCVYVGTNTGWVLSLNADTGEVVWAEELASDPLLAGLSGGIFSVAVHQGRVFANVSASGSPYAAALSQETGEVLWSTVVDEDPASYTNSSVQIVDGMVFIGISGPEDGPDDRRHPGGFALLNPATGDVLKRTWPVSLDEDARGIKGGSMWGTPVWDPETGFMYDGTGQPANKAREARHSNALIKVDVDRDRETFGDVVGYYKGQLDEGQDVDFGGSPTMFRDADGNLLVGALQKSGVFHAAFADTMDQAWWRRLAEPIALGSSGSAGNDGDNVYVATSFGTGRYRTGILQTEGETHPGAIFSLRAHDGALNWRLPHAGVIDYHPIALANGVVYMVTNHGILLGVNADTGRPVLARPMALDVGDACLNLSGGASIARHTVFAHCDTGVVGGGWLVAYERNPALPPLPVIP